MCEVLIDDFSLLNAALEDAQIVPLGASAGMDLGNAEAVHRVVASLLRFTTIRHTDDWTGRRQVFPVQVRGPHVAARADLAARLHLALDNPRRLTLIPCDGWGAAGWWAIEDARLVAETDDFAALGPNGYHAYTVELGVEAFVHSTDRHTVSADAGLDDDPIWDASTDDDTGWTVVGGAVDYSPGNYYGVTTNPSIPFQPDVLSNPLFTWDDSYTQIVAELKADADGPGAFRMYTDSDSAIKSPVAHEDLGSGWWRVTFNLNELHPSLSAYEGINFSHYSYDGATNLKVRKITAKAVDLGGDTHTLYVDVPGSAPVGGRIEVAGDITQGVLVYTCPNLPETVGYHPGGATSDDEWPVGTYHFVGFLDSVGADVYAVDWEFGAQSGRFYLDDVSEDGWSTFCHGLQLPLNARPSGVLAPPAAPTFTAVADGAADDLTIVGFMLWMGDQATGRGGGAYTAVDSASSHLWIEAPTPDRPVPGVFSGDGNASNMQQDNATIAAFGAHWMRPGVNRIMVAHLDGEVLSPEVSVAWSGYPAFHTHVVPSGRWGTVPDDPPNLPTDPILPPA